MLRRALLTLAAFGAFAAPAQAITLDPAREPFQRWADRSLVPTPTMSVTFDETAANCGAMPACAAYGYIGVDPGRFRFGLRQAFLHEVGHIFDFAYLTPGDHDSFKALVGASDRPWTDSRHPERGIGEAFADAYSACARIPRAEMPAHSWIGAVRVDRATLRHVCGWIRLRAPSG